MRAITPVAHEATIIAAVLDHHVGQAQRQSAVRAGSHTEPDISLVGEASSTRINDDQLHPPLKGIDDSRGMGQAGVRGIVAPQEQAPTARDVWHGAAGARAHASYAVDKAR